MNKRVTNNLNILILCYNRNYNFNLRPLQIKNFTCHALHRNKSILPTLFQMKSSNFQYRALRNIHDENFIKRTLRKIKFELFVQKKLEKNASILYTKIHNNVEVQKFFDTCGLPDTFYSWYLVNELHVWMICTRFMAEGENGMFIRNIFLKSLWMDIDERSKKLEGSNLSARKRQAAEIKEHFRVSFFSYDEALNGDDKVLASALWRILFLKKCKDPERIECCVNYVRKNLAHLDSFSYGEMILNSKLEFLPLLEPNQLNRL